MAMTQLIAAGSGEIPANHLSDQPLKSGLGTPTKLLKCLGRIAQKRFHLGRAKITRIDFYYHLPGFDTDITLCRVYLNYGACFRQTLAIPTDLQAKLIRG